VVLAHGDPTVRKALRDLTTQSLGMQIVGEAGDATTLLTHVENERPDLVIVAWQLVAPGAAGAVAELRAPFDGARIVVLGPRPDRRQAALDAGADAYISMVDAPDVVAGILRPATCADSSHDSTTQRRSGHAGGEKTHEPGGSS
jgi:DNA-binding NarL/FixJ family response regulator